MHRNAPLTPEGRLRLCQGSRTAGRWPRGRVDAHLTPDRPQVVAPLSRSGTTWSRGPLEPASAMPNENAGQGRAKSG